MKSTTRTRHVAFVHRSASDDGNPSSAVWEWVVTAIGTGSMVSVTWTLTPRTFWRRALLSRTVLAGARG